MVSTSVRGLFCLGTLLALALSTTQIRAQDPPAEVFKPETAPTVKKSYDEKAEAETAQKKERERQRLLKKDVELRAFFANTLWNDAELRVGDSGSRWWLRIRKSKAPESTWTRKWNLSDHDDLPEVGSWDVKQGELLFLAADNRIVARGTLDEFGEVHGTYYNPDRKHTFGSFHLIQEYQRLYTTGPFHVIDPNAGK